MTQVNFRVDEHVKEEADELFDRLGLSLSAAITIFLKQSISRRGIPFLIGEASQDAPKASAYCVNSATARPGRNVAALAALAGSWKDARTTREIVRDVEGHRTRGRRVNL